MNIIDFKYSHIEKAKCIARQNYEEERNIVSDLPAMDTMPDLEEFADNKMGVAAFDRGEMIGFLCACPVFDNAFGITGVKGIWSPIHAHAAVKDNREIIFKRMYQAVSEKWVAAGAVSHAITLYSHDKQAISGFFQDGFGLRCIDAIKLLSNIKNSTETVYEFREMGRNEAGKITGLRNLLIEHLGQSPCFMRFPQISEKEAEEKVNSRNSRVFTVADNGKYIAFAEISDNGENFISAVSDMINICGAYIMPEYRGKGVYYNLLCYVMQTLKNEGYKRLGVDFESFNPTAYGFWLKYFTAYTYSVVRRIDERAVI